MFNLSRLLHSYFRYDLPYFFFSHALDAYTHAGLACRNYYIIVVPTLPSLLLLHLLLPLSLGNVSYIAIIILCYILYVIIITILLIINIIIILLSIIVCIRIRVVNCFVLVRVWYIR